MSSSKSSGTGSGKDPKTETPSKSLSRRVSKALGASRKTSTKEGEFEDTLPVKGLGTLRQKVEGTPISEAKATIPVPVPGELHLFAWDVMGDPKNGLGHFYDPDREYKLVRQSKKLGYIEKGWRDDADVRDTSLGDIPVMMALVSKSKEALSADS